MSRTAVVAFSGGLDTSCIVSWLLEDYAFDRVIAVLVDVGQAFDIDASIVRGEAAGAADVLLVDRKEAFADEQVAKALKANALYEGRYPLVSALSRPVIAAAVAEIALELDADAVVHGCTGKGNDQLRFELVLPRQLSGRGGDRAAPRHGLDARRGDRVRDRRRGSPSPRQPRLRTRSTRTSSGDRSSAACSRTRGRRRPRSRTS